MRVLRVRGGCAAMTLARVCLLMHTGVSSRCSSCSSLPRTTAPVLGHHTAMLDKLSLTHGCVHRTERVQQQPSATIIRCVQWMQRSRNHSQSLWRPACRPHSTHNHKPWVQFCTHACFSNHGLYTGCNLHPFYKTMVCYTGCKLHTFYKTMVCYRGCNLQPVYKPWFCNRSANWIPLYKPWFVYGVQFCTHDCFTNHGLYTGSNLHPEYKPWFVSKLCLLYQPWFLYGLQITSLVPTMVCERGANCIPGTIF